MRSFHWAIGTGLLLGAASVVSSDAALGAAAPAANASAAVAPLLEEVEHYAMNEYARALDAGTTLSAEQLNAVAQQLNQYTGLPVDYIVKANLRINGGEFEKNVEGDDTITGRLDTRFLGPTFDPLSEEAEYDPQSAAISSELDFKHAPPGVMMPMQQTPNVMPDLEVAMQYDPQLHVMLNAGYFDLATPFYEGIHELQHLRLAPAQRGNVQFAFYESGHMVYVNEQALQQLHANVARFIEQTDGGSSGARGAATAAGSSP